MDGLMVSTVPLDGEFETFKANFVKSVGEKYYPLGWEQYLKEFYTHIVPDLPISNDVDNLGHSMGKFYSQSYGYIEMTTGNSANEKKWAFEPGTTDYDNFRRCFAAAAHPRYPPAPKVLRDLFDDVVKDTWSQDKISRFGNYAGIFYRNTAHRREVVCTH